ncbi:gnt1 [Symbiodinium sp. CCMP2456]|nr:gnt1 [Symbiodinium sp. CCMP2456]
MAWGLRGSMRTTGRSRTVFAAFLAACGIFAHWSISFVNAWTACEAWQFLGARPSCTCGRRCCRSGQRWANLCLYSRICGPRAACHYAVVNCRGFAAGADSIWDSCAAALLTFFAISKEDTGAGWHFEGHGWDRDRLLGRRLVYFGERHEEPAVCTAQLAALQKWLEANPATPTALVLEHFTAQQQHILDRWGQDDPHELVEEYEAQNGEFDIGLYEPLLTAAAQAKVRLVAGFPSRAEAREAVRGSMDVREMEELHKLMGPDTLADHFRLFAAMIAGAPVSEHETGEVATRGRQIFPAQCWKDFVCAKVIVGLLESHHQTMVVCGCGHSDFGLGIPSRVEALAKRQLPHLLPLQQLIVTARARDEEVVAKFRGHSLADILIRYDE